MQDLFERLRSEGELELLRLKNDRIEEDLQLEFKTKSSVEKDGLSDDDKRAIGEALSGFSNSAGGILVMGVDCRRGVDGIDCIQSLSPFIAPLKIASDVKSMLGSLLQPSNDGIQIQHIYSKEDEGKGYLAIFVPRSERRPHQSRAAKHFKYFNRVGRDFHPMEHYAIEDAFARVGAVALELKEVIKPANSNPSSRTYLVEIYMHNYSDRIAKYPYVVIENLIGCTMPMNHTEQPLKIERGINRTALFGAADDIIHPGTERVVLRLFVQFNTFADRWINIHDSTNNIFSLSCLFGCENGRAMRHHLSLSSIAFGAPP